MGSLLLIRIGYEGFVADANPRIRFIFDHFTGGNNALGPDPKLIKLNGSYQENEEYRNAYPMKGQHE